MNERFPSEAHLVELKAKGDDGRRSDDDLWAWHAYDYGWRRVMLNTRDDISPLDPKHEWFNAGLAAKAEIFYCRKLNKPAPDLAARTGHRPAPTADEIAHIGRCMVEIRRNLEIYSHRTRQAFAEKRWPGPDVWDEAQRVLDMSAKPAKTPRHEDPAEIRRAAIELGLIKPDVDDVA